MMNRFWNVHKRFLSALLCLVLLVSLVPAFALSASAISYEANISASASNVQYHASGCVKSIDISFQAKELYGTAYGKIAVHNGISSYDYYHRYSNDGDSWPSLTADPTFVALGSGNEVLWTDREPHTMTVSFPDGVIQSGNGQTYYVYLWTRSTRYGVYPDKLVGSISFEGQLKFNDTVVDDDPVAPPVHVHSWVADVTGNGTKEAAAAISCTGCQETASVTLSAEDATLPDSVFTAQILQKTRALPGNLTVSQTPGYKHSATGRDYVAVDPATFQAQAGYYQASILIMDGSTQVANLFVSYTVTDPVVNAPTGDSRPIEIMVMGMAAFSAMAAAAFLLNRKQSQSR